MPVCSILRLYLETSSQEYHRYFLYHSNDFNTSSSEMSKLLIVDNYDSFTYNLVECIRKSKWQDYCLRYNDQIDLDEVQDYDKILLSPGPDLPSKAGLMPEIIKRYHKSKDILGVCLGHQAIAEFFGAEIIKSNDILHGVATSAYQTTHQTQLYNNIPKQFTVGRYHSWQVNPDSLPDFLVPTAVDQNGVILSLKHTELQIQGVQYHPESIMTSCGQQILENWLFS